MKKIIVTLICISMHLFSLQQDEFSNRFLCDEHFLFYRNLMIESSIHRLENLIQEDASSYEMEKEIEVLKLVIGS